MNSKAMGHRVRQAPKAPSDQMNHKLSWALAYSLAGHWVGVPDDDLQDVPSLGHGRKEGLLEGLNSHHLWLHHIVSERKWLKRTPQGIKLTPHSP